VVMRRIVRATFFSVRDRWSRLEKIDDHLAIFSDRYESSGLWDRFGQLACKRKFDGFFVSTEDFIGRRSLRTQQHSDGRSIRHLPTPQLVYKTTGQCAVPEYIYRAVNISSIE
jgi:hypothetical protein